MDIIPRSDDTISALAHELGEAVGPRQPWIFLTRNEASGEVVVFSNRPPAEIRILLGHYLGGKR
jgi:hypothetical protein